MKRSSSSSTSLHLSDKASLLHHAPQPLLERLSSAEERRSRSGCGAWCRREALSERCNEVLEELERFIDGELPADQIADLAAHLNECPPCLYRADFQAKLKEILRE